ncbi:DUF5682 family protein, partial [Streptomyces sp. UNOC14_S4]|uniref:DUF5682 family protein n=1 Tax=Streptomyces sp. UNOC14_S4 TaxID=2872340 RepID=UPI001E3E0ABA
MTGTGGPALLGIRHHGPGSARAVAAALDRCAPEAVLVEGPPEADAIVHLAADGGMRPPVALLAYAVDDPGRSVFWPLADFSPEWVAIRWALAHDVPVRLVDLPAAHTLALQDQQDDQQGRPEREHRPLPGAGPAEPRHPAVDGDPLAALAAAAGHDDPERWWEDVVEHRGGAGAGVAADTAAGAGDALAPFRALAEAMAELRAGHAESPYDAAREAYMRLKLREARREFGDAVAVVCGAWHVPALAEKRTVAADRAHLKGLPKVRADISWVPWTHRRLTRRSNYGAGIASPGWYGHLFHAPDRPVERWMTECARLLRAEDHPVSSAHVIEAVRLAEALAGLRGRPLAGLTETLDAVRAVMCDGSGAPLALVEERLVVGDALGEVPDSAPATPLQRDLARLQRSLRLAPEAAARERVLDLRKDIDAARSRLLHRLLLLGVDWGRPARSRGGTGTFRETWRLRWEPELSVRLAEAGVWGTTVVAAATERARAAAVASPALADLTVLAERCLLADLPDALPAVMRVLADRAALDADVVHLAKALPALVRSVRYGDVRRTDTAALGEVAEGLAERVFVGLPAACAGLDADAAADMRGVVDGVHHAVGLLAGARPASGSGLRVASGLGLRDRWVGVLWLLAGRDALPGVVRGRAARLLLDAPFPGVRPPGCLLRSARGCGCVVAGRAVPRAPYGARDRAGRAYAAEPHDATQARAGLRQGRFDDGAACGSDGELVPVLMERALSPVTEPAEAAAWIEGFLGDGADDGMLLVHDERLFGLVDGWLCAVPTGAFTGVLPLLRRTFSAFEPGVLRALGELVRGVAAPGGLGDGGGFGAGLDAEPVS